MGTGPAAKTGFDLALTEVLKDTHHYFVAEVGTELGGDILKSMKCVKATDEQIMAVNELCEKAANHMGRSLDTADLKTILYRNSEHPRWEHTAARCLTCANCTISSMVYVLPTPAAAPRKTVSLPRAALLIFSKIASGSGRSSCLLLCITLSHNHAAIASLQKRGAKLSSAKFTAEFFPFPHCGLDSCSNPGVF